MTDPVLVSIVVPTFHSQATLPALAAGLRAQSFAGPHEIIVVDNSRDATPDVVTRLLPAATLIRVPERITAGQARNRGLQLARAPIVAFIDSDCEPSPGWLDALHAALDEETVAGAGGPVENGEPQSLVAWAEYFCEFSEFHAHRRDGEALSFVPTCNAAYRRRDLLDVGGFGTTDAGEDVLVAAAISQQTGRRIVHAAGMRVLHHNRTKLGAFMRNQAKLGAGFVASRQERPELAGAGLVRWWPGLFLLPLIRIVTRAKYARAGGRMLHFLGVAPLVFLGLCAHAAGAIRARLAAS